MDSAEWTLASRISVTTNDTYESMPPLERVDPTSSESHAHESTSASLEEPSSLTPLESTPMTEHEMTTTTISSSNDPASSTATGSNITGTDPTESVIGDDNRVITSDVPDSVELSINSTSFSVIGRTRSTSSVPYSTTSASSTEPYLTSSLAPSEPSTLVTTTDVTSAVSSVPLTTSENGSVSTDNGTDPTATSESTTSLDPSTLPSPSSHESPEEPTTAATETTLESSLQTEYGPHPADPNENVVAVEIQGTARVAALQTTQWIRATWLCTHLSAYHKLLLVSYYYKS